MIFKDINGQIFCYDLSNYKKLETFGLDADNDI